MTQIKAIKEINPSRDTIANLIANILPVDDLEREHIEDTLCWIQRGAPLFRIQKPDIPPKHLVSYFILLDREESKVLLVDHRKAQLWLPAGGHVEENEYPRDTVVRECFEELGVEAELLFDEPIFLTSTSTVGLTPGHTDVTLWYVLKGHQHDTYLFDREEFTTIKWFPFDEIPFEKSDPHMRRFIKKLGGYL